jgi:hypothetical protein
LIYFYSITRDNASANDISIQEFKNHYNLLAIKFYGYIACVTHVLNLVIQDILKAISKDKYYSFDNNAYSMENNKEKILQVSFINILITFFRLFSLEKKSEKLLLFLNTTNKIF